MKKIIAAVVVIGGLVVYIIISRSAQTTAVVTEATTTSGTIVTQPQGTSTTGSTPPTPTPTPKPVSIYKDGSFTGDNVDAVYGPMQVTAVISGGKLTAVTILKKPTGRGETDQINGAALPTLVQESITAQSANVDGVSGATQSSDGFKSSLTSALVKAKA
ncbi:MAG: FMN-binding protein [Candidatus Kaiserbacteria bacterium]|nr:FMN-binding protein [Candidatus Kaiserbacteria bacterium]